MALKFASLHSLTICMLATVCLLLSGCAAHRALSVDPPYPPELKKHQQDMLNAVAVLKPDQTAEKELRNQYIDQVIISVNRNFRDYKNSIYLGRASFDTLTDFTVLALSGVTAVTGTAATKAALGAATAGVTGARQSVNSNFFQNNARDAVFSMMDTLRQTELGVINQNEQKSIADYTMADALRDLDAYYEMGTVLKAEQTIFGASTSGGTNPTPAQGSAAITAQPSGTAVAAGQTATLQVTAAGAGAITYQWYQGASGDTSSPVPGATNSSFTTPGLAATTNYWVRATSPTGHVDSNTATVTVNAAGAPTITAQPSGTAIGGGQTATLQVAAAGTGAITYQWYQGASGDTSSPAPGATNSSFTTPALAVTTSYWVRVTSPTGHVDSNTATVTVNAAGAPTITTQPADKSIASGSSTSLSVIAAGTPPLSYQWFAGNAGDTNTPMASGNSSTFNTPALTSTTRFWVLVTNAAGRANSTAATVTVTQVKATNAGPKATVTAVDALRKSVANQASSAAH